MRRRNDWMAPLTVTKRSMYGTRLPPSTTCDWKKTAFLSRTRDSAFGAGSTPE
ncbi:hypothetical protein ACFPRL_24090 [Pseudoclavibacter helvolus]